MGVEVTVIRTYIHSPQAGACQTSSLLLLARYESRSGPVDIANMFHLTIEI